MGARGLILAAPASGSGKTTLTLGLLAAYRAAGRAVAGAKAGPDYIDPQFHAAASGRPALNLDVWAMPPALLTALAGQAAAGAELLLIEGVMGLFDGPPGGGGATADLAAALGLPVVLVLDVAKQAQSAAALVRGFRDHRPDLRLAGLLCNRVGGPGHRRLLAEALAPLGLPVLGYLSRDPALGLPERHLGLVQAGEHAGLAGFLAGAARQVAAEVDLAQLADLAAPLPAQSVAGVRMARESPPAALAPLGQRIAVARDAAFAFAYPHLLDGWRARGAEILPFSPLADQAPAFAADAVFLPGGYPELHAGRLAGNREFLDGLGRAAARGAVIYGECGGYMVLGEGLEDGEGRRHAMAGLLPLETSFATRRLHLGYRAVTTLQAGPWGPGGVSLRGHEFHYATVLREGAALRLFAARDAGGRDLGAVGLTAGRVAGSFLHLIA